MKIWEQTLRRCQTAALIVAVVGSVAGVVDFLAAPSEFWPAYHISFLFWWQITIGFLSLSLLRGIIRSHWGNATWPYLTSSLATIPLAAILFIPIVFGLPYLFPWAAEASHAEAHSNSFQAAYFDRTFFLGRSVVYFAIWIVGAFVAARAGTSTGDSRLPRRLTSFALIGLVLSSTFASFDWGMSLEPEWYSTIYGAMVLISGVVGAMTILILSLVLLLRTPRSSGLRLRQITNDLGNLLLAFLMIWTYFAFSQYLIIWAGNLPSEVTWYLRRSETSWQVVLLLVVAFHFIVPFLLLLSREQKQNPRRLGLVAALLFGANLLQSIWTYAPSFADDFTQIHWSLATSLLGMGGWWVLIYTKILGRSLRSEEIMRSGRGR